MENDRQFNKFLSKTMDDMKMMVDNTQILGSPMRLSKDEVIIPVIKLTFGFGMGGSEFGTLNQKDNDLLFETGNEFPYGGGSLGGMVVNPEAFIYINQGEVQLIKMENSSSLYEKLLQFYKNVIKK